MITGRMTAFTDLQICRFVIRSKIRKVSERGSDPALVRDDLDGRGRVQPGTRIADGTG